MGEFGLVAFMAGQFCTGDYVHVQITNSLLQKCLFGETTSFKFSRVSNDLSRRSRVNFGLGKILLSDTAPISLHLYYAITSAGSKLRL
jgi:hypothetical protein